MMMIMFRIEPSTVMSRLLEPVSSLPLLKARAVASITGAALADGAARPLHWIYNREELEAILQVRGCLLVSHWSMSSDSGLSLVNI